MLSNAEMMMGVIHEADVHEATAHGEHRFAARLATRVNAKAAQPATTGWKVWKQLGASRVGRKAA